MLRQPRRRAGGPGAEPRGGRTDRRSGITVDDDQRRCCGPAV